jgi:hypothetical protein
MKSVENEPTFRIHMLHLFSRSNDKPSKEAASKLMLISHLACCLGLKFEAYVSPKRRLIFGGLHDVISHKGDHLITTAVRISNPKIL